MRSFIARCALAAYGWATGARFVIVYERLVYHKGADEYDPHREWVGFASEAEARRRFAEVRACHPRRIFNPRLCILAEPLGTLEDTHGRYPD